MFSNLQNFLVDCVSDPFGPINPADCTKLQQSGDVDRLGLPPDSVASRDIQRLGITGLRKCFRDADWEVRLEAAQTLGEITDQDLIRPAAHSLCEVLLHDEKPEVRWQAVHAIRTLGRDAVLNSQRALQAALQDQSPAVGAAAAQALRSYPRQVGPSCFPLSHQVSLESETSTAATSERNTHRVTFRKWPSLCEVPDVPDRGNLTDEATSFGRGRREAFVALGAADREMLERPNLTPRPSNFQAHALILLGGGSAETSACEDAGISPLSVSQFLAKDQHSRDRSDYQERVLGPMADRALGPGAREERCVLPGCLGCNPVSCRTSWAEQFRDSTATCEAAPNGRIQVSV
mmetsp:Transcript_85792/g.157338  ORF Transcript_85792/g.157338 Transcript_85792/m.157338 type:complete len:348 (-) Transcript_85792:1-1044(-)